MSSKTKLKRNRLAAALFAFAPALALAAENPTSLSATGALIKTSGMLFFVLVIIYLLAWLLKKQQQPGTTRQRELALIECLPLGKNERLCLVKAGNRFLLLGVGTSGVNQIGEIPEEQISNPEPAANGLQWAQQLLNRK